MPKKSKETEDDHDILAEKERIANNPAPHRSLGGGLHSDEIGSVKAKVPHRNNISQRSINSFSSQNGEKIIEDSRPGVDKPSCDSSSSVNDDDMKQITNDRIQNSQVRDTQHARLSDDHDILAEKERIANNPAPYRTLGGGLYDDEIGSVKVNLPHRSLRSMNQGDQIREESSAGVEKFSCNSSFGEMDDDINQIINDRINNSEAFEMPLPLESQETSIQEEKRILANRLNASPINNKQSERDSTSNPGSSSLRRHGSIGSTNPPNVPKKQNSYTERTDVEEQFHDGRDLTNNLRNSRQRNYEATTSNANEDRNAKMFSMGNSNTSFEPYTHEDRNAKLPFAGTSRNLSLISSDPDDESTVPSMVPLVRQRNTTVPPNSQLLTPANPMVKVKPQEGEQMPGAYAAAGTAYDDSQAPSNHSGIEDLVDESTDLNPTIESSAAFSHVQSLERSEAVETAADPPPLTLDVSGGITTSTAEIEPVPAHQVPPPPGNTKRRCGIWPCWAVVVLVLCLTAGIVVAVIALITPGGKDASNAATIAPTPFPCSFQSMVLDTCSRNESIFLDVPECAKDRYRELLEIFEPSLYEQGLQVDEITCSIDNLAFLGMAFNTRTNDVQVLRDWFSLTVFYISTEYFKSSALSKWLKKGSNPCTGWEGVACESTLSPSNASRVTSIVLPDRKLGGTLPPNIMQLFPKLNLLSLPSNKLKGTLSDDYANLKYLLLRGNQISGYFPSFLTQSKTLKFLDLRNNKFREGSVSMPDWFPGKQWEYINFDGLVFKKGQLPLGLLYLTNLISLSLTKNGLSGSIPTEIGLLSNLQSLVLEDNDLTGSLPSEVGNLTKLGVAYDSEYIQKGYFQLEAPYLSFKNNKLSGALPSELGRLNHLKTIYLSQNRFIGSMPTEIGSLSNLESFTFARNKLNGEIPLQLCDLVTDGKLKVFGWEDCVWHDQSYGGLRCKNYSCCKCLLLE